MVEKWTTPILIITGQNDFRIPYTQSLEAFQAAKLHGVPSRLLLRGRISLGYKTSECCDMAA
ncbi:MAG: prolyl oligopeptidase family serine peptidase [Bacteroidales bacterium]|nr:prolyl oligopeptidase family serine peptidase [Bacteroidales bacterium]